MGLTSADYRDPRTGQDLMGSLYYSLIKSVNQCILKKDVDEDKEKGNETFGSADDTFMGDEWEEVNVEEGPQWDALLGNGHVLDSDNETQGNEDSDDETQNHGEKDIA